MAQFWTLDVLPWGRGLCCPWSAMPWFCPGMPAFSEFQPLLESVGPRILHREEGLSDGLPSWYVWTPPPGQHHWPM